MTPALAIEPIGRKASTAEAATARSERRWYAPYKLKTLAERYKQKDLLIVTIPWGGMWALPSLEGKRRAENEN
jgi:hypothetical protein